MQNEEDSSMLVNVEEIMKSTARYHITLLIIFTALVTALMLISLFFVAEHLDIKNKEVFAEINDHNNRVNKIFEEASLIFEDDTIQEMIENAETMDDFAKITEVTSNKLKELRDELRLLTKEFSQKVRQK